MPNTLDIEAFLVSENQTAESLFRFEKRDAIIKDANGNIIFEQKDVVFPEGWSDTAVNIVASKYFHGHLYSKERENDIRQLIGRVADTIAKSGEKQGYFDRLGAKIFRNELAYILYAQIASFNSPVWFNVGIKTAPQSSACFILSVQDNMDSIFEWYRNEGRIFKSGSGAGINISSLRSSKEPVSGGGTASGPLSFMRAADASAGVIKSGGKLRRAAKNIIMDIDHPDIKEFIECKMKEEAKAKALISCGFDGEMGGEAYSSVFYQNANHTVSISDDFMYAVRESGDWELNSVVEKEVIALTSAEGLFNSIAESVHACGDPGVAFSDTINTWNTCKNSGRIRASNPCQEFVWLDNSACNLASINLVQVQNEGEESFKHIVDILITAQDILIDMSCYPTDKIKKNSINYRPLGLGITNLGGYLMRNGIPYDSIEGIDTAKLFVDTMTCEAYAQSARIAKVKGAFRAYKSNKKVMNEVLKQHQNASKCKLDWEETMRLIDEYWVRNSQVTLMAPTGTISFMMDCDSTGIEPVMALMYKKKLAGGGEITTVSDAMIPALDSLGYSDGDKLIIMEKFEDKGILELPDTNKRVFKCAMGDEELRITPEAHLTMVAAVQPHISGAISKTINLPNETTVDEIKRLIFEAWTCGIKCITFYRDGCKGVQPVTVEDRRVNIKEEGAKPMRRCLPTECRSIRHKFEVGGLEGYMHVGLHEDGTPGELFTTVSKEGSTVAGLMDTISTLTSLALQYGVPLEALVEKFSHVRFEPSGMTHDSQIPFASSMIDYIFRWMGMRFLSEEVQRNVGLLNGHNGNGNHVKNGKASDANICQECGAIMSKSGNCYTCVSCGANTGCG